MSTMVADRFGLPLATLIPTATVAGVALGFGAQRVPHDIVSGFFLLAEHQMAIGDWVTIAARGTVGGVGGNVEQITLRVTRLRTIEGEVVFVPDGEIRQLTSQSIGWGPIRGRCAVAPGGRPGAGALDPPEGQRRDARASSGGRGDSSRGPAIPVYVVTTDPPTSAVSTTVADQSTTTESTTTGVPTTMTTPARSESTTSTSGVSGPTADG